MSDGWNQTEVTLPLNGEVVETKIHDARGVIAEQRLRRHGELWYDEDYALCVYYTPTHWREAVSDE